jgi:hypothetical protein
LGDSFFSATEIIPLVDAANAILEAGQTMKMKDFHEIFAPSNTGTLRATAKSLDIKITGSMKPWEHCFVSKSKQKNVPKVTETKSTVAGERLFLDKCSVKFPSYGGCGQNTTKWTARQRESGFPLVSKAHGCATLSSNQ